MVTALASGESSTGLLVFSSDYSEFGRRSWSSLQSGLHGVANVPGVMPGEATENRGQTELREKIIYICIFIILCTLYIKYIVMRYRIYI